jgi:hypothetical protein
MQPTRIQVEQSLAALANGAGHPDHAAGGIRSAAAAHEQMVVAIESLPDGLLAELEQTIDIRPDRLDRAREHLAHLDELTATELADRIVGRLVCDRLR